MNIAEELVAKIWQEAQARAAAAEARAPASGPAAPALAHDGQLAYLNAHWAFATSPASDQPSRPRRARERFGRFLAFPTRYFAEEREFLANVVRFQNEVARRLDEVVEEQRRLREDLRAEARRLAERDQLLHDLLEARLAALEARSN